MGGDRRWEQAPPGDAAPGAGYKPGWWDGGWPSPRLSSAGGPAASGVDGTAPPVYLDVHIGVLY